MGASSGQPRGRSRGAGIGCCSVSINSRRAFAIRAAESAPGRADVAMVAGIAEASVGAAFAGLWVAIIGAAASLIAVAWALGAAGVVRLNTVAVRAAL